MQTEETQLFAAPRLRDGVKISLLAESVDLSYRHQGAEIDFPAHLSEDVRRLFDMLAAGGRSQAKLAEQCPELADQLEGFIQELDRLGVLTETMAGKSRSSSGAHTFWCELQRFIAVVEQEIVTSRFFHAMNRGETTINQMHGYVMEYYHIVHQSPGIIAPSLSHCEPPTTQKILCDFLKSEMGHDEMIAEALLSVGYTPGQLETMVPLPMTFAISSSLGVYAEQHPLSFKAALFLLERPQPEFHIAFQKQCTRLGLPESFINPILQHSGINEDGDHEDISRLLLSDIPHVSAEEQTVVKKHVFTLLENMSRLEEQILTYYGDTRNPIPRCF